MTRYRNMTGADYDAVARILTESSRGKAFDFGSLDRWSLVGLSSFWRFSLDYSYIVERQGEPAAVLIACVDDPATREAFAYYLGLLPEAQGSGAGAKLSRQLLLDLQRDGFRTLYAETTTGSPREMFERLGARATHEFLTLRGDPPPPSAVAAPVERLRADQPESWYQAPQPGVWSERPAFLRTVARHLTVLRGPAGGILVSSSGTHILHLHLPAGATAEEAAILLRSLAQHQAESSFVCAGVRRDSREHHALLELGFAIVQPSHGLAWDLTQPLPFR